MEGILEYVKSILLFLLFLKFFLMLLPDKAYEKYARPACMLLLFVLVIKPVVKNGSDIEALLERAGAGVLAETKKQDAFFLQKADGSADIFADAVLLEYKNGLEEDVRERAKAEGYRTGEIWLDLSTEADSFGSIRFLRVALEKNAAKKSNKIDRIRILTASERQREEHRTKTAEELYLAEVFAVKFGIGKNQVDVSITD